VTSSYVDAVAEVQRRGRFGVRLGLGRTRALLRELGSPERSIRGALVGGTNGKGSVLALVGSALREAGLRAGETPKPHLQTYRERMQVGGAPVSAATFARLVGDAAAAVERVARTHGEPTEFELLTALSFRWFADVGVDLAVIEVGLGGRLDATHAWDGGVAAITNVELDHTAYLGDTIPAIAREKAAIVMPGDRAVTGATGEALHVVRERARRAGAPLSIASTPRLIGLDRDGIVVDLDGLGPTRVGLRGRHQAANVAVADGVLDALAAAGIVAVDGDARRRGYAAATWPGRLELLAVGGGREVLLDGAHNPGGAAVLATALDDLRPFLAGGSERRPPPLTLVTAVMADKDVAGVVAALSRSSALTGGRVVCTTLSEARALAAGDLAAAWRRSDAAVTVAVEADPIAALDAALADAPGPIVVAGSLYLVGAVRAALVRDPILADPDDPATGAGAREWRR